MRQYCTKSVKCVRSVGVTGESNHLAGGRRTLESDRADRGGQSMVDEGRHQITVRIAQKLEMPGSVARLSIPYPLIQPRSGATASLSASRLSC